MIRRAESGWSGAEDDAAKFAAVALNLGFASSRVLRKYAKTLQNLGDRYFAERANDLFDLEKRLLRHLLGSRGIGFESDAAVFRLTQHNIAALTLPIDILNTDYLSGLAGISVASDQLLIIFIAPPWGDAFDRTSGVDLRRTTLPIIEIVDFLLYRFSQNHLLCAIQVYEVVLPVSMAELRARFDWSTLRIFQLNTPGQNHGILLGTKDWAPQVIAP